jgi:photosystem II stability/assembly factor-like uncharacterized protein
MTRPRTRTQAPAHLLLCFLLAGSLGASASPAAAQGSEASLEASLVANLEWRNIGPVGAGGRITDIAVLGDFPFRMYIGAATGGLWKSDNNGVTWDPIFDDEGSGGVGAVAALSSSPDVVWVGTGEANVRNSVSWGDGVYKSTDAGRSWTHMGLRDSHHIGRIVIDPRDPDVVWVAAAGRLWGPTSERGLYKTTDGGLTWTQSLWIDENTGVIDVAMDPHDSNTLYAASWERRQTYPGGPDAQATGPGSGLHKTTDGGRTWKRLSEGLPTVDMGRIGVTVSRSDPNVVYAIIQTPNRGGGGRGGGRGGQGAQQRQPDLDDGGVFRSADRGESWEWVNPINNRPDYYSQIRVDPRDPDRLYVLDVRLHVSEDGGRTFRTLPINVHVDHHALWINPDQPRHLVLGNDGGVYFSYDGGRTWDFVNQMAITQFYAIDVDMQTPYHVYGGAQDYMSWGGPSRTRNQIGITDADWYRIMTGDGFQVRVDPTDHTIVYAESQNGGLIRRDINTGRNTSIRPIPEEGEDPYRFNWETPILISPHDPATIYVGANFVFRSTDRAYTWSRISPELPEDERGTITVLSESPVRQGLLYAGTDDGTLHVTRDGGATWTDITDNVRGLPGRRWVSRVVASGFDEGTAYATFDGHRWNDFVPHVYRTTDFGRNWESISANLPEGHTVRVIREDVHNPDLLFVGTEFGAWFTIDGGGRWTPLMNGMPTVAMADMVVHPRDGELVAGTHGRSAFILDIAPLQQLDRAVLDADLHAFEPRPTPAYDLRIYSDDQFLGEKRWAASNPPVGATVSYWLKEAAGVEATLTVTDPAGRTVRELSGPAERGINRVLWDLRSEGSRSSQSGPLVEPGAYRVAVSVDGREATTTVTVEPDRLLNINIAQREARRRDLDRLLEVQKAADEGAAAADSLVERLDALSTGLDALSTRLDAAGTVDSVRTQLSEALTEARETAAEFNRLGGSVNGLYNQVNGWPHEPTTTQRREIERRARELEAARASLTALVERSIPALDRAIGTLRLRVPAGRR